MIRHVHTDRRISRSLAKRGLLACAASILLLSGCGADSPPKKAPPPEVSLESLQFRAWRGAELTASGRADAAVYRRDTGLVSAANAQVNVPRPGMPELTVTAPKLTGDLRARTWAAAGGVVLTRGDATARTPTARWAESDGLVRGDETVEVTGPGYRLRGPAFVADPGNGDVEIRGGVRLVAGGGQP